MDDTSSGKNQELEKILARAGIPEGISVRYVKRSDGDILEYRPSSSYYNDVFGEDSSHEESARILDGNGETLCSVECGYTARYSNGSSGGREGESVRIAINKLGDRTQLAKWVLVQGRNEIQDNTIIVSRSANHECKGLVTKSEEKWTLYEL